jgi:hypothetical protein
LRPFSGSFANKEGRKDQIAWWSQAPIGLTMDMLALTGFIPSQAYNQLLLRGVNGTDTVERIFGGQIHFRQPKDRKTKQQLDKILLLLNRILQIRAAAQHEIEDIDNIIGTEWGGHGDALPKNMPEYLKDIYDTYKIDSATHPIAKRPQAVFTLLKIREALTSIQQNPGYYSRIFAVANTLFHEMLLDITTVAIENMGLKDTPEFPIELDYATKKVMEDAQEGLWGKS